MSDENTPKIDAVELATELTIAWLGNANTRASAEEVPAFLGKMHDALLTLAKTPASEEDGERASEYTPAVSVRKSLASPNYIISMIDGKPYKTLTRHLTKHGLDAKTYRERYGLISDYPMTAPAYSEARRAMAKKIGLGRKPGEGKGRKSAAPAAPKAPAKRGRKPGAAAARAEG